MVAEAVEQVGHAQQHGHFPLRVGGVARQLRGLITMVAHGVAQAVRAAGLVLFVEALGALQRQLGEVAQRIDAGIDGADGARHGQAALGIPIGFGQRADGTVAAADFGQRLAQLCRVASGFGGIECRHGRTQIDAGLVFWFVLVHREVHGGSGNKGVERMLGSGLRCGVPRKAGPSREQVAAATRS